jgi:hypothetical protein
MSFDSPTSHALLLGGDFPIQRVGYRGQTAVHQPLHLSRP